MIIDGGKGLEAALAALWPRVPVQRCTVHKLRNLMAHTPKKRHEELTADYRAMIYAESPSPGARPGRQAFLRQWRLRCPGVARSLEEAGERLFAFLRYPTRLTSPLDPCNTQPVSRPSVNFYQVPDTTKLR